MRRLLVATVLVFAVPPVCFGLGPFGSSTVHWENDAFAVGRETTDRFYTNGVRIVLALDEDRQPPWAIDLKDRFCECVPCGKEDLNESVAVLVGHNFYTPQTITISEPQPDDRPWAGHVYVGLSESITNVSQTVQHTLEATVGVLGQGAGGQWLQKFVHNDLGFSDNDPLGWRHQLKNEPTLSLSYQQARRTLQVGEVFDLVPQFGALLGTPQTHVNAGGLVRLGWHISGLPAPLIRGTAATTREPPHRWEAYLFIGGEGRWVPYNATLDGGLIHDDGPEANDPERFVTDFRRGLSLRYKRLRLTYSLVDRSVEFDVPPGYRGTQRFGAYAVTFEPSREFR